VITYAVTATGTVRRLPCRTITAPGPTGVTWYHCTCRPGVRVADPARALHAGERPADRLAAEMKDGAR
jgi:hypothetical protein